MSKGIQNKSRRHRKYPETAYLTVTTKLIIIKQNGVSLYLQSWKTITEILTYI